MILDEEFPPDPRVQNEAQALISNGNSVVLFCLDYKGKLKEEVINGITVKRFRAHWILQKLAALTYSFPFYNRILIPEIKKFLSSGNYDAIHVHDMRIGKAVLEASKEFRIPKIIDLHENRPEIMQLYEHVRNFPGNILIYPSVWKKWEKKLVLAFDKIIVITQEAKDCIVRDYQIPKDKVLLFPNSVSSSFYQNYKLKEDIVNKFKDKYVLLYIGDTGKRRGLETVIKSIPTLKDKIPNIAFVILGKSKNDDRLKELVEKNNLQQYVHFEGYQPMELFQSYIWASKVGISPLLRNKHHDTTYANKIFQYMSIGLPVVVSDCTAQKRIVESANAGLSHIANSAEDFEKKIMEIYDHPKIAAKFGENAKKFVVNEFNLDKTSNELINYYKSIKLQNVRKFVSENPI